MTTSKTLKLGIVTLLIGIGAVLFYKKVYLPKSTYAVYYASKGNTSVEVFGIGELDAKDCQFSCHVDA